MEELGSSSDSDRDSDGYSKEIEEELYSVLHHNDFSQGIPAELLDKYSISTGSKNEFVISLKQAKDSETKSVLKKDVAAELSSCSSSEDDIVVVETDESTPLALTPNSSANGGHKQVVIEEDSDGSSSVQIIDMPKKRKHSEASDISAISLSSDGENLDLTINTTGGTCYDSDDNVSDVVDKTVIEWTAVASPSSWTREMRKYYNSPCERLRYFDHKKIRQGIRNEGSEDWFISHRDRYPEKRWTPRCDICRQSDHRARDCPKQDPTCHMCGIHGHTNQECPNSICLQCGLKNNQYTATCSHCSHMLQRPCFNCNQKGHESKFCPEKWRQFHSTVEGTTSKPKTSESVHFLCCNCGATNHAYEQCNQTYLANITKSLPAYDWLHGKRGFDDWRFGGSSPGNGRHPPKRQKFSHGSPFRGNRSSDLDFERDRFDHEPPLPLLQSPFPPWHLNRSQRPKKSKSVKRKDRRRKNDKNKQLGINFR